MEVCPPHPSKNRCRITTPSCHVHARASSGLALTSPYLHTRSAVFAMKVLCPKTSIHAFLHCGIRDLTDTAVGGQQWQAAKIDRLRAEMGDFDVLIIDELSTTAAAHLVGLDGILRRVFDMSRPFGGKTVHPLPHLSRQLRLIFDRSHPLSHPFGIKTVVPDRCSPASRPYQSTNNHTDASFMLPSNRLSGVEILVKLDHSAL